MKFNNTYKKLGDSFFTLSSPAKCNHPKLVILNKELSRKLGFDFQQYDNETLAQIFSGQLKLEGSEFISQVYAAHQFGHFVPILGDGRAILLGEVIDVNNCRYDIQLKGAGPTMYSRRGDGYSALGPVLREFLVSEFMHTMNIPSTRALAVVATNQKVIREEVLDGGILTRVASSHIRFGTFQYFFANKMFKELRDLLNYSIERHYHFIDRNNKKEISLNFFKEVVKRQTDLVARWMSIGFIHGVMNTDNMTISGETIDFGPCAFMDHFDFNKVFSYIDRNSRYSFGNQPKILAWNLARLADTLIPLYIEDNNCNEGEAVNIFNNEISNSMSMFQEKFIFYFSNKLQIEDLEENLKSDMVMKLISIMHENELDFTETFRSIASRVANESSTIDDSLKDFVNSLINHFNNKKLDLVSVKRNMDKVNPVYIPRNHLIEELIEEAYQGSFESFYKMSEILTRPYSENDLIDVKYKMAPRPEQIVKNTFCGT